jgi:hypothetical protein
MKSASRCFHYTDINNEFLAFKKLHHICSRNVTYTRNCSTLMLLTPIMWCFLSSGGTLNILHQYSVSMVFGTVNCGQNKTHGQSDITDILGRIWRKYPISDLQERCSLKLHLRPQLWEMSITLKYCIFNFQVFRSRDLKRKIYRVIRNDCGSFNNLSYTIHLR